MLLSRRWPTTVALVALVLVIIGMAAAGSEGLGEEPGPGDSPASPESLSIVRVLGFYVRYNSFVVEADTIDYGSAFCDAGDMATGGQWALGCNECDTTDTMQYLGGSPWVTGPDAHPSGWLVRFKNGHPSSAMTISVSVICAHVAQEASMLPFVSKDHE